MAKRNHQRRKAITAFLAREGPQTTSEVLDHLNNKLAHGAKSINSVGMILTGMRDVEKVDYINDPRPCRLSTAGARQCVWDLKN